MREHMRHFRCKTKTAAVFVVEQLWFTQAYILYISCIWQNYMDC